MIIKEEDYLSHIGTPRHSGRYPYGSGQDPQRNTSLLQRIDSLAKQGLSQTEIAKGLGFVNGEEVNTTRLRALKSIAKNEQKAADISQAERLAATGMSNIAIGKEMAINGKPRNESSIRALREPGAKDKADALINISNMLEKHVKEKKFIQIGAGVSNQLQISPDKLKVAVQILKEKGYKVYTVQSPQLGTKNNKTGVKVLSPPGTTYLDVKKNMKDIKMISDYSEDSGRSFMFGILPPVQISSKRVQVKYNEDGGGKEDGMIYVRPGKKDLSLGSNHYAQVRIQVNDTHYLKGMAMYRDDLPAGVDVQFNTKKSKHNENIKSDLDAMKKLEKDPDMPFGSIVRQIGLHDAAGNLTKVTSAMNLVNEEGVWETWKDTLPSQMLSKQSPKLAKLQLDQTFDQKKTTFDELSALTNPTVKKLLLDKHSASIDSAAVQLHAASLHRQSTHVLLPITTMKENEIYAPKFNNGEQVVLIRFPHGGIFEIPELTVNNQNAKAKKLIGPKAKDAVGINAKVAARLSGADFDGDTVLVIPNSLNNRNRIKNKPPLEKLIGFDPIQAYPKYEGMIPMSKSQKALHMGDISNLITDMTIGGAIDNEIARAVKHSMVVIDAEKHELNYKQSAIDNGIKSLKEKYQTSARKGSVRGASTLISRAKSDLRIPDQKLRKPQYGGPVDPKTGKLIWVPTNVTYPQKKLVKEKDPVTGRLLKDPITGKTINKINPVTGKPVYVETGKIVPKMIQTTKLANTDDAHTLVSVPGTEIERIYADHSNRLKDLANQARKESVNTKVPPSQPSARIAYKKEVDSLDAKFNLAMENKPLERQAQIVANGIVADKKLAHPDMDEKEIKKLDYLALAEQRKRFGSDKKKVQIVITPTEWQAIQAGAISNARLDDILKMTDLDNIKKLATPRTKTLMPSGKAQRARDMLDNGATQAEVANALGVSMSTLKATLKELEKG